MAHKASTNRIRGKKTKAFISSRSKIRDSWLLNLKVHILYKITYFFCKISVSYEINGFIETI